ncbi:2-hydroxy-3-keto-5-methylthiopentenyl-1-phosphate phosphatase [Elusimicrobium posterum]|uniref:HAD-IB family phosphatase n=1 Tax=Elusimicrobium posterum TaxID=3116653 RepID=UPI003C70BE4C
MKYALITDFDGTITMRDMAHVLIEHYKVNGITCEPDHECDDDAKVWMRCHIGAIQAPQNEFEHFVKTTAVARHGFKDVADFCLSNNIPLEITSGGVDIYIKPVLETIDVKDIPVYSANGRFKEGGGIEINYPLLENFLLADFKAHRVKHYKKQGYTTIYCGDGMTDYKAALEADIAFATANLLDAMRKEGREVKELSSYKEVEKILQGHKR